MVIKNLKKASRSEKLASEVLPLALKIIKDEGGELPVSELIGKVEKQVEFDEWALEKYNNGQTRWKTMLYFYSIDGVKAGFLVKKNSIWYLTPEGNEALEKYNNLEFILAASAAYKKWKKRSLNAPNKSTNSNEENSDFEVSLDEIEQNAEKTLINHINLKNPYEFQDMCAALLRGMGYFTPFISPKGKDGGIDIIAYRDPLGTESPRIKIQVKHRKDNSATVQEIRQLMGLIQNVGEIGIFISTGGFTSDAKSATRNAQTHIELIDISRF